MPKTVLGLDLSLKSTGVAIIRDGKLVSTTAIVYAPDKDEMTKTKTGKSKTLTDRQKIERLHHISMEVHSIAVAQEAEAVAIEGYAFSRHSSSVTGLAELGGVVRVGLLRLMDLVPMTFSVKSCRKFVVGRGNVTKAQAQTWLKDQGFKFDTDDEADAFVVGLTGYYVANPSFRHTLTVKQLEIIDGITKEARRKGH